MLLNRKDAINAFHALDQFISGAKTTHTKLAWRMARNLRKLKPVKDEFDRDKTNAHEAGRKLVRGKPVLEITYQKGPDGADLLDAEGKRVEATRGFVMKEGAEKEIEELLEGLLEKSDEVEIHLVPLEWLDGVEGANQSKLFFHCEWMFEAESE